MIVGRLGFRPSPATPDHNSETRPLGRKLLFAKKCLLKERGTAVWLRHLNCMSQLKMRKGARPTRLLLTDDDILQGIQTFMLNELSSIPFKSDISLLGL